MASIIHPPATLKLKESSNAGLSWKKFKQSWDLYERASGTAEKTAEIRLATFLHVAGANAIEKYGSFQWQSLEDKNNFDKVIDEFNEDFQKSINVVAENSRVNMQFCQP